MKRIIVAGKNSYIGDHLADMLDPTRFTCDILDMRGNAWRDTCFTGYDAVVLVAGIAHQHETDANRALYDQVNHKLAAEAGRKAKQDGVRQFVFFSSMSVYGLEVGHIHADTTPNPETAYGRSKLAAELELQGLADETFHVAILRPPMIYGPGCKGNYPRLSKMVRRLHVFPKVNNERSMLYINTLCAFMDALLQNGNGGLYFPQNSTYVSTNQLARAVADAHHSRLWQPSGFGWLLRMLGKNGGVIGKVFGTLVYDMEMSGTFMPENQPDLAQSILQTETTT